MNLLGEILFSWSYDLYSHVGLMIMWAYIQVCDGVRKLCVVRHKVIQIKIWNKMSWIALEVVSSCF